MINNDRNPLLEYFAGNIKIAKYRDQLIRELASMSYEQLLLFKNDVIKNNESSSTLEDIYKLVFQRIVETYPDYFSPKQDNSFDYAIDELKYLLLIIPKLKEATKEIENTFLIESKKVAHPWDFVNELQFFCDKLGTRLHNSYVELRSDKKYQFYLKDPKTWGQYILEESQNEEEPYHFLMAIRLLLDRVNISTITIVEISNERMNPRLEYDFFETKEYKDVVNEIIESQAYISYVSSFTNQESLREAIEIKFPQKLFKSFKFLVERQFIEMSDEDIINFINSFGVVSPSIKNYYKSDAKFNNQAVLLKNGKKLKLLRPIFAYWFRSKFIECEKQHYAERLAYLFDGLEGFSKESLRRDVVNLPFVKSEAEPLKGSDAKNLSSG